MPVPSFFIVGAPKCGTTSLNDYLRQHPGIFIPERKELHHFGSDLRFFKSARPTHGEYLANFAPAQPDQIAGEASVWYLFSQLAAQEIHDFCPAAKIIIMLRSPADMLHSLHSQYLFESNEDLADFAAALAAEEDRGQGRRLPPGSNYREGLLYRRVARFAEHYLRHFAAQCGRTLDGFSPEASARLLAYTWPGNLRELSNAIERAVIMARESQIEPGDLPVELRAAPGADGGAEAAGPVQDRHQPCQGQPVLHRVDQTHGAGSLFCHFGHGEIRFLGENLKSLLHCGVLTPSG